MAYKSSDLSSEYVREFVAYLMKWDELPNIRDPRVRSSMRRAVDWIEVKVLGPNGNKVHRIHSSEIQKYLQTTLTGKLLRLMLTETDADDGQPQYSDGKGERGKSCSKPYLIKMEAFICITFWLEVGEYRYPEQENVIAILAERYRKKYPSICDGSENATYRDKTLRMWHELQFVPSVIRDRLFQNSLPHNYDINSALPTMMYQKAMQLGFPQSGPIEAYLDDREPTLRKIMQYGLSKDQAKEMMTAIFNRCVLTTYRERAVAKMLDGTNGANELRKDEKFLALYDDIRAMWKVLYSISTSGLNKKGKWVKLHWKTYFRLEHAVMLRVVEYMKSLGHTRWFLEHDGFRVAYPINEKSLSRYVLKTTGFNLTWKNEPLLNKNAKRKLWSGKTKDSPALQLYEAQVAWYRYLTGMGFDYDIALGKSKEMLLEVRTNLRSRKLIDNQLRRSKCQK